MFRACLYRGGRHDDDDDDDDEKKKKDDDFSFVSPRERERWERERQEEVKRPHRFLRTRYDGTSSS